MPDHEVLSLIRLADTAISDQDFEALMRFYAEDAVLVVQPGQIARGKPQIRRAFEAILRHFDHALRVEQGAAEVIEGGDTALVIMETLLFVGDAEAPITRRATYVFKRDGAGHWLCTVDNSYGTEILT